MIAQEKREKNRRTMRTALASGLAVNTRLSRSRSAPCARRGNKSVCGEINNYLQLLKASLRNSRHQISPTYHRNILIVNQSLHQHILLHCPSEGGFGRSPRCCFEESVLDSRHSDEAIMQVRWFRAHGADASGNE